jgi:hypothetical protein
MDFQPSHLPEGRADNLPDILLAVRSTPEPAAPSIGVYRSGFTISLWEIERLLAVNNLKFPFFRLFQNGAKIGRDRCVLSARCGSATEYDIANLEFLYRSIKNGATLELLDIARSSRLISGLSRSIERESEYRGVVCHAYFSLKDASSFGRHTDPHDVLAIQVAGEKTWTFDNNVLLNEINPSRAAYPLENKLQTVTLSPGDVLYVPRGLHHDTATTGRGSCHVSLSLPSANALAKRARLGAAVRSLRLEETFRYRLNARLFRGEITQADLKTFSDLQKTFEKQFSGAPEKAMDGHEESLSEVLGIRS